MKHELTNDSRNYVRKIAQQEHVVLDEFDSLLCSIIIDAFNLGRSESRAEAAEAGRVQRLANSNRQAEDLKPIIQDLRKRGIDTLKDIADELNDLGIKTRLGHQWHPSTVRLLLERINHNQRQKD